DENRPGAGARLPPRKLTGGGGEPRDDRRLHVSQHRFSHLGEGGGRPWGIRFETASVCHLDALPLRPRLNAMTPSDRGSQPHRAAGQARESSPRLPAHVARRRRRTLGVLSLVVLGLLVLGTGGIVNAVGSRGGDEGETAAEGTQTEPTTSAPVPDEKAASGS